MTRIACLKEMLALEEARAPLARQLVAIDTRLHELRRITPQKTIPHSNIKRPRRSSTP